MRKWHLQFREFWYPLKQMNEEDISEEKALNLYSLMLKVKSV